MAWLSFLLALWVSLQMCTAKTIWDTVQSDPRLQTLSDTLIAFNLFDELDSSTQTWTLVASINEAFDSIVTLTWDPDVHMLMGEIDPVDGLTVSTTNSFIWFFDRSGDFTACSSNCATIIESIPADNGVLHVVDAIIKGAKDDKMGTMLSTDYSTFWAIADASLKQRLNSVGEHWTVFVPIEAAWDATFSKEQFECLGTNELSNIIDYHLIEDKVYPTVLLETKSYETVSTDHLPIIAESGVVVVDGVALRERDTLGSNGVLHEVDHVLVPPKYSYEWFLANCENIEYDIWEVLNSDPSFDSFSQLVYNAELDDELSGGLWTIFAPPDIAFELLPDEDLEKIPVGLMIAEGTFDLENASLLPVLDPTSFLRAFETLDGNWTVCSGSCADIVSKVEVTNGVIYIIDKVVFPSHAGTITNYINTEPPFDVLQAMFNLTTFDELLNREDGNFTFLAPSDEAWVSSVHASDMVCLLDGKHNGDLEKILAAHLIPSSIIAPFQFEDTIHISLTDYPLSVEVTNETVTTVIQTSPTSSITITTTERVVTVNSTATVEETYYTTNGVMHVLDIALLPRQYNRKWFEENCEGTWVSANLLIPLLLSLYHFVSQ